MKRIALVAALVLVPGLSGCSRSPVAPEAPRAWFADDDDPAFNSAPEPVPPDTINPAQLMGGHAMGSGT